jgi:hypothetical protein
MATELRLIVIRTEEGNGNSYGVFNVDNPRDVVKLNGKRLVGFDMLTAYEKAAAYREQFEERNIPLDARPESGLVY